MKITKIKANNFKSLKDFEIKFSKTVNTNIIFGVNGAGKSTILEVLSAIQTIFKLKIDEQNQLRMNFPFKPNTFIDLGSLYNTCSTIGFKDEVEMGIEFCDKNMNEFYYDINLGPNGIVTFEEFGEIKNKNRKIIFSKKFNSSIEFESIKEIFQAEMYELNKLEKNSIASLLYFIILKNYQNFKRDFSREKYEFIIPLFDTLVDFSQHIKNTEEENAYVEMSHTLFAGGGVLLNRNHPDYERWMKKIKKESEEFSDFACSIDSSIIEITVNALPIRGSQDVNIEFGFVKRINGKVITIPWRQESKGTKNYSDIFSRYKRLKGRKLGFVEIIDEFGTSMNEVLIVEIFKKFYERAKENDRQIILTTHSTILLNKEFLVQKDNFNWNKERFIIDRNNADGMVRAFDLRNIDKKENNQKKYLIGKYGGTPVFKEYFSE